ncbi:hypothetical protein ACHAWF_008224 [Thalassiosira exigua]
MSLPAANYLLSPMNAVIRLELPVVYLNRIEALLHAIKDSRTIIKESMTKSTHCKQLVREWPHYIGVKDASKHGVWGIIVGECEECVPTVFRVEWLEDIKREVVSRSNPRGRLTNSDLKCGGLLILRLVMECVCPCLQRKHSALFSDNDPTVGWVFQMAAKRSVVAMQLLRVLGLRMAKAECSPLTPLHVKGLHNSMTDIPSRSFGSEPKWYCKTDDDLRRLFNKKFPLPKRPHQTSWTVFHVSSALSMKVISVLRMKVSSLAEWHQLPSAGTFTGEIGAPMSRLWEWTLTYRRPRIEPGSDASRDSRQGSAQDSTVTDAKWGLEQSLRLSRPLARRSPWPLASTPPN